MFQIIGIDLEGPLYLRTGEKASFVLFTCAVIREVHIALMLSLSRIRPAHTVDFLPPTAAWWGGCLRVIKDVLRRVLGKARLGQDELVTVPCETESIVNHRPLTDLSEDVEDLLPLTLSLFLQEVKDSCVTDSEVLDSTIANKRYRCRQKLKEDLRKRFRTLGQLRHYSGDK